MPGRLRPDPLELVLGIVLAAFYLAAGVFHLIAPGGFLRIMPPIVPFPEAVVVLSEAQVAPSCHANDASSVANVRSTTFEPLTMHSPAEVVPAMDSRWT